MTPQNWTLGRGQTGGMFGVGKLLLNCCLHCTYSMRHYGRIYQITKLVQVHHFKTITFFVKEGFALLDSKARNYFQNVTKRLCENVSETFIFFGGSGAHSESENVSEND